MKSYNNIIDFSNEYKISIDQSGEPDLTVIAIFKNSKDKVKVLETKIIEPREDIEEYVLNNVSDWIKENNNKIITCVDLYDKFIKLNK